MPMAVYNIPEHLQAVSGLFRSVPTVMKNYLAKNPNFKIQVLGSKTPTQGMPEFLNYLDKHLNTQIYGLTTADLANCSGNPVLAKQLDVALALEVLERGLIQPPEMARLLRDSHYQQPRPEGAEITMTFLQALSSISIGVANPIESAWRELVRVIRSGFRTAGKSGVNWSEFYYSVKEKGAMFVEQLLVALFTHQEDATRLLLARRPAQPGSRNSPLSATEFKDLKTAYQDIKSADEQDRAESQLRFEELVNGMFGFDPQGQEQQDPSDSEREDLEEEWHLDPRSTEMGMPKPWLDLLMQFATSLKVVRAITELERRPHLRILFQNFDIHAGARAQEALSWLVDREALKLIDLREAGQHVGRLQYREDSLKQLIVDFAPKWISTWMTPAIIRSHPDFTKLLEMHADRRLQDVLPETAQPTAKPQRQAQPARRRERHPASDQRAAAPPISDGKSAMVSRPRFQSGAQQQQRPPSSRGRSQRRDYNSSNYRQQSGQQQARQHQEADSAPYRPPMARAGSRGGRQGAAQRRVNFDTPPEAKHDNRARPHSASPRLPNRTGRDHGAPASQSSSASSLRRSSRIQNQSSNTEERVAMADAGFHAHCSRLSADRLRRTQEMLARGGDDDQVRMLLPVDIRSDVSLERQLGTEFSSNNAGDGPPKTLNSPETTTVSVPESTAGDLQLPALAAPLSGSIESDQLGDPASDQTRDKDREKASPMAITTPDDSVVPAPTMPLSYTPATRPPERSPAVSQTRDNDGTGEPPALTQAWDKTPDLDEAWCQEVTRNLCIISHTPKSRADEWRNCLQALQALLETPDRRGSPKPKPNAAAHEIVRRRFLMDFPTDHSAVLAPGELSMEKKLPSFSPEDTLNLERYVARTAPQRPMKQTDDELRYVRASYNCGAGRMPCSYMDPRGDHNLQRREGQWANRQAILSRRQNAHPGRESCSRCCPTPASAVDMELISSEAPVETPSPPEEIAARMRSPERPDDAVTNFTMPTYLQKIAVKWALDADGKAILRKWVQELFDSQLYMAADPDLRAGNMLSVKSKMLMTHCVLGASDAKEFTAYSPPGFRTCRDAQGVQYSIRRRNQPLSTALQWRTEAHATRIVAYVLDPRYTELSYLLRWEVDGFDDRPLYTTVRASALFAARQVSLLNDFKEEQLSIPLTHGTLRQAYRCHEAITPELTAVLDILKISELDAHQLKGHVTAVAHLLIRALAAHAASAEHPEFTEVQSTWSTLHPVLEDFDNQSSTPHPCSEGWTFMIGGACQMSTILSLWNRHQGTGRPQEGRGDAHLRCSCFLHRERNCEVLPCPPAFLHLNVTTGWQDLRRHCWLLPALTFVRCRTTQHDFAELNKIRQQVRLRFDQHQHRDLGSLAPSTADMDRLLAATWLDSLPKARGVFRSWRLRRPLRKHQLLFRLKSEAREERDTRLQARQEGPAFRSNNAGDGPQGEPSSLTARRASAANSYGDSDEDSVPTSSEGADSETCLAGCEVCKAMDPEGEPPSLYQRVMRQALEGGRLLQGGQELPTETPTAAPSQSGEEERKLRTCPDSVFLVSALRRAALPKREPFSRRGIFEEALEATRASSWQKKARDLFFGEDSLRPDLPLPEANPSPLPYSRSRKRRRPGGDGKQLGTSYRSNNAGDGPGAARTIARARFPRRRYIDSADASTSPKGDGQKASPMVPSTPTRRFRTVTMEGLAPEFISRNLARPASFPAPRRSCTATGGTSPSHQKINKREITGSSNSTLVVSVLQRATIPRQRTTCRHHDREDRSARRPRRPRRVSPRPRKARRIAVTRGPIRTLREIVPKKQLRGKEAVHQLGVQYRSNFAGDGPMSRGTAAARSGPDKTRPCVDYRSVSSKDASGHWEKWKKWSFDPTKVAAGFLHLPADLVPDDLLRLPPPQEHDTDPHQRGVAYRSNEAGDGPDCKASTSPSHSDTGVPSEEESDEDGDEPPPHSDAASETEDDMPELAFSSEEATDSECDSSESEDEALPWENEQQEEALSGHFATTISTSIVRRHAPGLFNQVAPAVGCNWTPNSATPLSLDGLVGENTRDLFFYNGPLAASRAYDPDRTSRLYSSWINRQSNHDRTPLPTVWADVLPGGPRSLIALVDTGSSQNLLDSRAATFLEQRGHTRVKLAKPITAQTAEPGHQLEFTHYMALPFSLQGSSTEFKAAFMITDLPKFDLLLGVNWACENRIDIHTAHSCLSWPVGREGREFLLYSLEAILRLEDPSYLDLLLRTMPPRKDVIGYDNSGRPLSLPTDPGSIAKTRMPPPSIEASVLWTEAQRSCEAEEELEALQAAACAHPTKPPPLSERPQCTQMLDKMLRAGGRIPVYSPPDEQIIEGHHGGPVTLFMDADCDPDEKYIFHPTALLLSEAHALAYPRAVVRPEDGVFRVEAVNITPAAQRVVPGDIVGYVEPFAKYDFKDSDARKEREQAERGLWKLADEGLELTNEELHHAEKVWADLSLNLDTTRISHSQLEVLRAIVFRFHDTWTTSTDAPRASTKIPKELLMKLELKEGEEPVNIKRFRKSALEREHIREFVDDALKKGIIKPTRSPWSSPMVLVKKKDSDKMRPCIDYRAVNKKVVLDAFPIPLIKDILDSLHGKAWFTLADARSGFHQMPLADDEESKRITAFHTPFGSYQWEVVPMGLVNSPSAFQRMVNFVLRGLGDQVAMAYLDDIVIMGSSFEEHTLNLYLTLQRLEEFDLRLAANKTHLCQQELLILGWIVSGDDVRPNPAKVQAVQDWLPPEKCKTEKQKRKSVKGLLGLAGFYRRAIKDFARIASPLTDLTKTGKKGEPAHPFVWTDEAQNSFQALKQALLSAPLLRHPDLSKKFLIDVDACKDGVGAVLSQVFEDNQEHPCAYFSKRYSEAEQKYASTELEALGVLKTIEHWRPYIHGQPFDMRTDSMNVLWGWLRNQDKGRLGRWAATLSQYEGLITFVSRKGRLNGNADGLSRRPHAEDSEEEADDEKLLGPHPTPPCAIPNRTPMQHGLTYDRMKESLKIPPTAAVVATQETEADLDARMDRLQATAFASENPAEVLPFADLLKELKVSSAADQTITDIRRQLGGEAAQPTAPATQQGLLKQLLRQYRWKDNLLWTRFSDDKGYTKPQSRRWLVYVPEQSRISVITTVHDRSAHQHLGAERSQKLIATAFYWPGLHLQVAKHVASCAWCQKYSDAKHGRPGPLQKVMRPEAPNRTLSIDLVGPFQLDAEPGVPQYALTMVDVHSNLAAACPIAGLLTAQVIQAFETAWLHVYGPPQTIISDRGTQFESKEFHAMLDQYGIKARRTTFAHPQANPVERIHRWLAKGLAILVAKYGERWPRYLTRVLYAYNTTNHHGTVITPYGLFFRRNAPTALLGIALLGNSEAELLDDFQQQTLLEMRSQLEQQRHKNFVANAKRRPTEPVQFPPGAWVMVKARKAGKLSSGWNGPFVVLGHTGLSTVRVRRKKWGKMANDVVNVNKLRLFKLSDQVQDPSALPLNLPAGLRIDTSTVPQTGWGILATSAIRAGTLLGRYKGEWLTAVAYHQRYPNDDPQFVVEASDANGNPAYIDARDPTLSNWLRYVQCSGPNESPNCELRAGGNGEDPTLISLRPIQPQEELLWEYGPSYRWPDGLPLDSANTKLLGDLARNRQAISDGKSASKASTRAKPTKPPLRRPPPSQAAISDAMRQGSVSQFDAEHSPLPAEGTYVIGAHPDVPNNLWCLGKVLQHEEDNGESYLRVQVYGTYSANAPLHRRQFRPAWVDNKDGKRVYSTRRNPSYVPWSVYIHSTDIWIAAVKPITVRNGVQLPKDVATLIPRILDRNVMLVRAIAAPMKL